MAKRCKCWVSVGLLMLRWEDLRGYRWATTPKAGVPNFWAADLYLLSN